MTEMSDLMWRKSSFSPTNNTCVECAGDGDTIAVRDNTYFGAGMLRFNRDDFRSFIRSL